MFVIFKKPTLHVDCFTYRQSVYEFFPIDYSSKSFPDWWKSLPMNFISEYNNISPVPTMKSCQGLIDFYKNGMTIPLWTDVVIGFNPDGSYKWQFSDLITEAMSHDFKMMTGFLNPKEFIHIKFMSPWIIECKEDVGFSWVGNTWAFHNPHEIMIPPAVVNFKYQTASNINMFIRSSQNGNPLIIKQDTPMVNILPLTERKLKIHLHLLSEQEYKSKHEKMGSNSFLRHYQVYKKKIQDREKSKCPFSWTWK